MTSCSGDNLTKVTGCVSWVMQSSANTQVMELSGDCSPCSSNDMRQRTHTQRSCQVRCYDSGDASLWVLPLEPKHSVEAVPAGHLQPIDATSAYQLQVLPRLACCCRQEHTVAAHWHLLCPGFMQVPGCTADLAAVGTSYCYVKRICPIHMKVRVCSIPAQEGTNSKHPSSTSYRDNTAGSMSLDAG
jgi:hypothetical protein